MIVFSKDACYEEFAQEFTQERLLRRLYQTRPWICLQQEEFAVI